jgi:hypothetical protein
MQGIAVIEVEKIQTFSGGEYHQTPLLLNAIPHQTFYYQQTIYHFISVWSLFVDGPPLTNS